MPTESLDGPRRGEPQASYQGEKEDLRREMRRLRASISPAERARLSGLIEESFFPLPQVDSASTVLLFYSVGSEVATGGIAQRILGSGKRLLLPYLTDGGEMEAAEVRPGDPTVPSSYGPKEPGSRVPLDPSEVDLVVTPGLAFDREGNRLGYGGGHYDRYLARLGGGAPRVGVAFSLQIVDRVPVVEGDERVDVVVTDQGAFEAPPVQ